MPITIHNDQVYCAHLLIDFQHPKFLNNDTGLSMHYSIHKNQNPVLNLD